LAAKKKKSKKKAAKKKAARPAKKAKASKKTAPKKPARRRRAPRFKPIEGPFQIGLPLQMPLALGHEAFAEKAPPPAPEPDEVVHVEPVAPAVEQVSLFGGPVDEGDT
jgi:hypothetical protein